MVGRDVVWLKIQDTENTYHSLCYALVIGNTYTLISVSQLIY